MKYFKWLTVVSFLTLLAACGGGSSSNPTPAANFVEGVASKGLISGGTVKVFALSSAGVKGDVLGQGTTGDGTTNTKGYYKIGIGPYVGPVLVEVTGGTYDDEATHQPVTNSTTIPLRAVHQGVTADTTKVSVTPLTELAVLHAGTLNAANITAANALISDLMKVDIVTTAPVAPTTAGFAAANQPQIDYSLLLAAVSQLMVTNAATLDATLATLNSGMSQAGMAGPVATAISGALATYVAANTAQNGMTTVPPSLQHLGFVTMKLTLALQGANAASVQALKTTMTLPAGLMLRSDASGVPLTTVLALTGSAAAAKNVNFTAKYSAASGGVPATIAIDLLAPEGGLAAGNIIIITCDVAVGATAPAASSVTLSGSDLRDTNGAVLGGATLSVL